MSILLGKLMPRAGWTSHPAARRRWRWRSRRGARSLLPLMLDTSRSASTATVGWTIEHFDIIYHPRCLLRARVQQHRLGPRCPRGRLRNHWRRRLLAGWLKIITCCLYFPLKHLYRWRTPGQRTGATTATCWCPRRTTIVGLPPMRRMFCLIWEAFEVCGQK